MNEILNGIAANPGAVTAAATVVIAFSAVFTAIVARMLARENRLLRKAGTEPKVVAYLTIPPLYRIFWNFVLANVGQGPARNVSFKFDADEDFLVQVLGLEPTILKPLEVFRNKWCAEPSVHGGKSTRIQ